VLGIGINRLQQRIWDHLRWMVNIAARLGPSRSRAASTFGSGHDRLWVRSISISSISVAEPQEY
jgi:hypothetical protein